MAFGVGDLPAGPLTKGLKAIFMKAYRDEVAKGLHKRICTIVPSDTDSEDYPWLGAVPQVREFLGERQARDLSNFNFNIKNKTWENTLGVLRSDMEDNKLGMLELRVRQLAIEAARYPDQLCCEFLTGALGSAASPYLCYDGQGFIDTDHVSGDSGSQSNKPTGAALAVATLWTAINAMLMLKNDAGVPMGITPDLLLVEPCLAQTGKELLSGEWPSTTGGAAQAKVLKDMNIECIVSPYLYSTATVANGNWFLLSTSGVVKPLIFQSRVPVEFGSLEKESESGFMRDMFYFGTRARYNVGAGAWFCIQGNAGAG
jgi:phage major head subunit gpT-like protein